MYRLRPPASMRAGVMSSLSSSSLFASSSSSSSPALFLPLCRSPPRSLSSPLFLSSPSRALSSSSSGPPSTGNSGPTSGPNPSLPSGSPPSFLTRFPWLLRLLGYYGVESTRLRLSSGLFRSCLAQSRLSPFYTVGRVKRDFRSRHLLLSLHVWLVHRRILHDIKSCEVPTSSSSSSPSSRVERSTSPQSADAAEISVRDAAELKLLQEALFDRLWDDTMVRIREQKVPELSVNSMLKNVQKYTFAACISLDHSQSLQPDVNAALDELGGALWRDVYGRNEALSVDHVHRLALYAAREQNRLLAMKASDFYAADIPWGKPPDWDNVLDDEGKPAETFRGEKDVERDIQDVEKKGGVAIRDDDDLKEGWASALSPGGKVYYWNMKTKETTWTRPTKNSNKGETV